MALLAQTLHCLSISLPIKAKAHTMTYKAAHDLPAPAASCPPPRVPQSLFSLPFFTHTSKLPAEGLHTGCSLCWQGPPDTRHLPHLGSFLARTSLVTLSQSLLTPTCYLPFLLHFCFLALLTFSCIICYKLICLISLTKM